MPKLKSVREAHEKTEEIIQKEESYDLSKDSVFLKRKFISTGSTLLDYNISGSRREGGGIPSGIIAEISGPFSSGKTTLAMEIAASALHNKGQIAFLDAERRFDVEYAADLGAYIDTNNSQQYRLLETVDDMFNFMGREWKIERTDVPNLIIADSIAALSSDWELNDKDIDDPTKQKDKMGMRAAKQFSLNFRRYKNFFADNNVTLLLINQQRQSNTGSKKTYGGNAVPYYASLRLVIKNPQSIDMTVLGTNQRLGINTTIKDIKTSIDRGGRECSVSFVSGYGVDDVRDNLEFVYGKGPYLLPKMVNNGVKNIQTAINHIDKYDLHDHVRDEAIAKWKEIEDEFNKRTERKPKQRR